MIEIDQDGNSDENEEQVTRVITEGKTLTKSLFIANYTQKQVDQCCAKTTQQRFNSKFGASPAVLCKIYRYLQKSEAEDTPVESPKSMRLEVSAANLKWFLWAIIYLQRYLTEDNFKMFFGLTSRYARRGTRPLIISL